MSTACPATTIITRPDKKGHLKARIGLNRNSFIIEPGLYSLGKPGPDSPVLATANYKLSFDRVRSSIPGTDAWILVLDTKGINVWCAAGKGTFGTEELIRKIVETNLHDTLTHREIIVPQLGAPGISAHLVKKYTGFRVIFGPVRSEDIPAFLEAGKNTNPDMRRVTFGLKDRAVLVPVEIKNWSKLALFFLPYLFLFHILRSGGIELTLLWDFFRYFGAILVGTAAVPLLLPYLPSKSFAVKGLIAGAVYSALVYLPARGDPLLFASHILFCSATAAFTALNFTGATPFTSVSGVKREMRIAIPFMAAAVLIAAGLQIVHLII